MKKLNLTQNRLSSLAVILLGNIVIAIVAMLLANFIVFHDFLVWLISTLANQLREYPKLPIEPGIVGFLIAIGYLIPLSILVTLQISRGATLLPWLISGIPAAFFFALATFFFWLNPDLILTPVTWLFFAFVSGFIFIGSVRWHKIVSNSSLMKESLDRVQAFIHYRQGSGLWLRLFWTVWVIAGLAMLVGGEKLANPFAELGFLILIVAIIQKLREA